MSLNLKVWVSEEDAKKQPEGTTFLRLVEDSWLGAPTVDVVVVDADGEMIKCGFVVTLFNDGTFMRQEGVNDEVGFDLDDDGSIKDHYPS